MDQQIERFETQINVERGGLVRGNQASLHKTKSKFVSNSTWIFCLTTQAHITSRRAPVLLMKRYDCAYERIDREIFNLPRCLLPSFIYEGDSGVKNGRTAQNKWTRARQTTVIN